MHAHGEPLSLAAATPVRARGRHLVNRDLIESVDARRLAFFGELDEEQRSRMGQFGTPLPVARLMASMFAPVPPRVNLLDAGAGVGSLTAAFVADLCERASPPAEINVTAVEAEPTFQAPLRAALALCGEHCQSHGVRFTSEVVTKDFIEWVVRSEADLFGRAQLSFNCAIQNPPYKKINSASAHRRLLRELGIEVSNLYAAFVALTVRLLEPGGQLVAITPRSFCNGPYFNSFRADFLSRMALGRIHVFDSRTEAFGGDGVLQENVIFHATGGRSSPGRVHITSSSGAADAPTSVLDVPYSSVVPSARKNPAIHVVPDGIALGVADRMETFRSSLDGLGLSISTGRVVDFRAKAHLRQHPGPSDAPLIYPLHLRDGGIRWPILEGRKPNAIATCQATRDLLVPPGIYVLTKRFSAKEQRRRIDAFICDSERIHVGAVGFENHVNYIHDNGHGLDAAMARGLFIYLGSTLVDMYFRLFSGHTQVNATDVRNMPFPDADGLRGVGRKVATPEMSQDEIDALFNEGLMAAKTGRRGDPVASMKRVREAQALLKALGFPRAQLNVRSALVLLALLDLKRDQKWSASSSPQLGISEMMDWFAESYGKRYAPNSRETVRRQTVHQFLDAGLIVQNPDDPGRPVNSGKNVYRIVPEALEIIRKFGTPEWEDTLHGYLAEVTTLKEKYAQRRQMERIPVTLHDGTELSLSPGGQNVLVEKIIRELVPRFAPGARLIYVGDTEHKWAYMDEQAFIDLGVAFDPHGKFPDVVVYFAEKNWLLLIEAVTSHGPVDAKRHGELKALFGDASAGLVFVTTFLTRRDLGKYLGEISWETEVWTADFPGHMIHFDGERFLGPSDA